MLVAVLCQGRFLDHAFAELITRSAGLPVALVQEMGYGTVRWAIKLQAIAAKLLKKPLKQKDQDIEMLLLLGLYQLEFMRLPAHAAVNETVAACKVLGKPWAKDLINACLRRFQREHDALLQAVNADPETATSHPGWVLSLIRKQWPDHWQQITEANNRRPTLSLRVNASKVSVQQYLQQLGDAGIKARPIPATDSGLILSEPQRVQDLPDFDSGYVSIQNGAAQLAPGFLDVEPGQQILDACAAPGGKLAHILETHDNIKNVVAIDSESARVELIKQTLGRLDLTATVIQADAGDPQTWRDNVSFDRILLDAPCSGTGVIRRHPDIKVHRTPEQIQKNIAAQSRLLDALWPLLVTGGKLLYVTCSILPDENENQMAAFLDRHSDARPETLTLADDNTTILPVNLAIGLQILPGQHEMDGFYYARITKA